MKNLFILLILLVPLSAMAQVDSLPLAVDSQTLTLVQVIDTVSVSEPGGAMSETAEKAFNWGSFFIFVAALVASTLLGRLKNLTEWQTTIVGIAMGITLFIVDLNKAGDITAMTPGDIWQALTVSLVGIISKNFTQKT